MFKDMKTRFFSISRLAFAGVLMVSGFGAKAGKGDNVSLIPEPDKKVIIDAYNPDMLPMSIEIIDNSQGESQFVTSVKGASHYSKLYNLSLLPNDDYTIKVKIGNEDFEKEVKLNRSVPEVVTESTRFEPVFQEGNNSLSLTVLNPEREKVSVSYWAGSDRFFEDDIRTVNSFTRKYNLKELDPGDYSVEVVKGGQYYVHNFVVK